MAHPILVTGAAGRVGAIGRTVTELLLKRGKAVRAMVRNEDERAQALRDMGAEVVIGDLLDLDSMHKAIAGCETMYFGMSVRIPIWPRRSTGGGSEASRCEGVHQYVADDTRTDEH
jgi:nucleoside-diphosphate-sugar epimerase